MSNQKRKQNRRKKNTKKQENTSQAFTTVILIGITAVILCVLVVWSSSLNRKLEAAQGTTDSLNAAIEEEKERTKSIESWQEATSTEEFIKQAAKERFGLVESDEILFRPED